jgi:hypothetical protein
MDSAARNFLALSGLSLVLTANAACGLAAYVVIPVLGGNASPDLAGLLPILLLASLLAVSAWLGISALRRNLTASRLLVRRVRPLAIPPSLKLLTSADAASLEGRVDLLDTEQRFSFVYGLIRPRVAISRGLLERLSPEELRAALEHEGYHVRNRDPLRTVIAVVLVDALFLLPSLAVLRRRYETGRELAADRSAVRRCGRRPLLGALLKALETPSWTRRASIASLGSRELLSIRVAQIETGTPPSFSDGGIADLGQSILGVGTLAAAFAAAIIGVGGSAALAGAVREQLSASGFAFSALCALPALALAAAAYLAPVIAGRSFPQPTPTEPG